MNRSSKTIKLKCNFIIFKNHNTLINFLNNYFSLKFLKFKTAKFL